MTCQIHIESITDPQKERCGDFVIHDRFDPGPVHFVAASDGVGSHKYDWAASETVCRSAAAAFGRARGNIKERLMRAVFTAHADVQDLEGSAAGATATLVVFVWEEGQETAHYVSIGDSRLYLVGADGPVLLTEDDSTSVPIRRGGEIVVEAGAVRFASGLTRAIGFGVLGSVDVSDTPLKNGEMLAAVTDGHHELPGFESRLTGVFDAVDLAQGVDSTLGAAHRRDGRDDASIAILRRSELPTEDLDLYLDVLREGRDFREAGLFKHLVTSACAWQLNEFARTSGLAELASLLGYMKLHGIVPPRSRIIPVLDQVAETAVPESKLLLDELVELAKRAG